MSDVLVGGLAPQMSRAQAVSSAAAPEASRSSQPVADEATSTNRLRDMKPSEPGRAGGVSSRGSRIVWRTLSL
jgi:hypothetical protein